jgi:hypothetical protein
MAFFHSYNSTRTSRAHIVSENYLIFSSYKKAYGTRGYEVKTLIIIIKKRRNPPWPCNSSSGMEPTSRHPTKQESSISNYHQAKNRGRKQPSNPNIKQKK